jgi:transposase
LVRGLMTDREWAFFAPFVITTGSKRGRPPTDHRHVLDAIFWIARTGAPWRDLDRSFGNWASVYRQFRRWTVAGLWDVMLDALNKTGRSPHTVQMIDSTIIRAHHQAAGAKGGLRSRVLGAQKVASRPKSISAPPRMVSRSAWRSPAAKSRTTRASTS